MDFDNILRREWLDLVFVKHVCTNSLWLCILCNKIERIVTITRWGVPFYVIMGIICDYGCLGHDLQPMNNAFV